MTGFTSDETFLHQLARQSFLQFWSWPNLFRDQGDAVRGGDGKEICDLIVIFGNDIILFSDKRISYSSEASPEVAWCRWARRAIAGSLKQVEGARRWLQKYPERVFLDKECTERLPIELPSMDKARFHSVIVCHGIEEEIIKARNEPSFGFDNTFGGQRIWSATSCQPFILGNISEHGFVHVFNEATIGLVLKEFDTTKDFLSYLREREVLLTWPRPLRVESESDIIQLYYENYDDLSGKRSIAGAEELKERAENIDKGGIGRLLHNESYLRKKQADRTSYFWDDLISAFSFHILEGTIQNHTWKHPHEAEPLMRHLAETSRFERRSLADAFINFYRQAQPGQRGTRLILAPDNPAQGYLFFLLPNVGFPDHEEYRLYRREMLGDYCMIAKTEEPQLESIIGIAARTRESDAPLDTSFFAEGQDLVMVDTSGWSATNTHEAEKLKRLYIEAGVLSEKKRTDSTIHEFPVDVPET